MAEPRRRGKLIHKLFRVWAVFGVAFLAWQFNAMQATAEVESFLKSDALVEVKDTGEIIEFIPKSKRPGPNLVFFPGSMVAPEAYAYLVGSVAHKGYPCYIVKLPWRSAPTASMRNDLFDRTRALMAKTKGEWVIAGHSKGGALAADFTSRYPEEVSALALIGTTHPKVIEGDLSRYKGLVAKVYGTADGVAPEAKSRGNAHLLPANAEWTRIEGGNHAGFAFYGPQLGDGSATISKQDQQDKTIDAILSLLRRAQTKASAGSERRPDRS